MDSIAASFVGKRLRQVREEMGLTQRELAAAIGVSRQCIGMAENDKGVTCDTLRKIAIFTGASCGYLLGVTDERLPIEGGAARCIKGRAGMEPFRESLEEIDSILREALEGKKDAERLRAAIRDAIFYMADVLIDMDEMMEERAFLQKEG